jgi:hypothetical protein
MKQKKGKTINNKKNPNVSNSGYEAFIDEKKMNSAELNRTHKEKEHKHNKKKTDILFIASVLFYCFSFFLIFTVLGNLANKLQERSVFSIIGVSYLVSFLCFCLIRGQTVSSCSMKCVVQKTEIRFQIVQCSNQIMFL